MTRILNVNLKRFMGTKYERIAKTLALWAILLFALKSSGVRIEISPTVIWLTTTVLTIGGFIQVLSSDDTIDRKSLGISFCFLSLGCFIYLVYKSRFAVGCICCSE